MTHSRRSNGEKDAAALEGAKEACCCDKRNDVDSDTTLQSVVQRMSQQDIAKDGEKSITSVRKTPFGVVRIPSGSYRPSVKGDRVVRDDSGRICVDLLPCIRQRTRYGSVQLDRNGLLSYRDEARDATLIWNLRSQDVELHQGGRYIRDEGDATYTKLHQRARSWLQRYSGKVVACAFRLTDDCTTSCTVYANGPRPDYEVTYDLTHRAAHGCRTRCTIRVSRQLSSITLWVSLADQKGQEHGACLRSATLPLQFFKSSRQPSALLDTILSRAELRLVYQTLSLCGKVDATFDAVCN